MAIHEALGVIAYELFELVGFACAGAANAHRATAMTASFTGVGMYPVSAMADDGVSRHGSSLR
jgi:hypothetical protein